MLYPPTICMPSNFNMPNFILNYHVVNVFFSIRREAYVKGKKEKPPFVFPSDDTDENSTTKKIPGELLCQLCKDLLTDAVVISCCGNSFCDECKWEKFDLS